MGERAADLELDPEMSSREDDRRALAYHERTKHHLDRYARSPAFLGWDYQPDPFRTFDGAPAVALPLLADGLTTPFADLFRPGAVAPRPLELGTVALLFELSLGLSAWKQYRGDRWALRCNPSSGNLHPTEGYAVLPELPGLGAGVYHYVSRDHRLERRCALEGPAADRLAGRLPPGTFLVGLSSIHWREAWKYGERAFRYCQHDAGHALAAVRYAAAALGWSAVLLDAPSDADLAALLGLDRPEDFAGVAPADREHPDAALLVGPPPLRPESLPLPLADWPLGGTWAGRANPLSPSHDPWEVIDEAAEATRKPATPPLEARPTSPVAPPLAARPRVPPARLDAHPTEAQRPGVRRPDRDRGRGLPRDARPPAAPPRRAPVGRADLAAEGPCGAVRPPCPGPGPGVLPVRARRLGARPPPRRGPRGPDLGAPAGLPRPPPAVPPGPARPPRRVPDHQLPPDGRLARRLQFGDDRRLRRHDPVRGAWWYRRLFWEAGMLGQVLYLEAEAAGVRGTGIGCYFDDAFHDLLGLSGDRFQDLYHFTVGAPVDDPRLTTLPPYGQYR